MENLPANTRKNWIKRLNMICEASLLHYLPTAWRSPTLKNASKIKPTNGDSFGSVSLCVCLKHVFSYSQNDQPLGCLDGSPLSETSHYEQCSKPAFVRWHVVCGTGTRFPWMMSFPNSSITRKNHHHLSMTPYYIPILICLTVKSL